MSQDTLFEVTPASITQITPQLPTVDWEALSGIALLYTATATGTNSGIRFAMTVRDAMAWCSSSESRGQLHGTAWAYMWTTVTNFLHRGEPYGSVSATLSIDGLEDSGAWDERIARYVRKISLADLPATLEPHGVTVVGTPLLGRVA